MILTKLQDDLKQAQLEKQDLKVSTLRLLLSEIHNSEIQKGSELEDSEVVNLIQREGKKRKEAAEAFRNGGREDGAQKEEAELNFLEEYLPTQMTNEELTQLVQQVITELGATSMVDMGKVIGVVMGKAAGRVEGGIVSALVKEKLS